MKSAGQSDIHAQLGRLTDQSDKALHLMSGLQDVMVRLIEFLKAHGNNSTAAASSSSASPATPAKSQPSADVIDLSQEWTGTIDKAVIDAILKELKNGRSALYVSVSLSV